MAGLMKRGNIFYVVWYVGKKEKRRSLRTDSLQIAKEKLRQFKSAKVQGDDLPLYIKPHNKPKHRPTESAFSVPLERSWHV